MAAPPPLPQSTARSVSSVQQTLITSFGLLASSGHREYHHASFGLSEAQLWFADAHSSRLTTDVTTAFAYRPATVVFFASFQNTRFRLDRLSRDNSPRLRHHNVFHLLSFAVVAWAVRLQALYSSFSSG